MTFLTHIPLCLKMMTIVTLLHLPEGSICPLSAHDRFETPVFVAVPWRHGGDRIQNIFLMGIDIKLFFIH